MIQQKAEFAAASSRDHGDDSDDDSLCNGSECVGDDVVVSLMERWRSGDRAAGDELARRVTPRLIRFARRIMPARLRKRTDPEDLVQSALAGVCRMLTAGDWTGPSGCALFPYLAGIVHNKARDTLRKKDEEIVGLDRDFAATAADSSATDWNDAVDELGSHVTQRLTVKEQSIFSLWCESFDILAVSVELKISTRTVYRCLAKVESLLERDLGPKRGPAAARHGDSDRFNDEADAQDGQAGLGAATPD